MKNLVLTVLSNGVRTPLQFDVRPVINAGYVGRDQAAVRAHVDELAREGVAPPPRVPMLYPLAATSVTTSEQIEVIGEETSGEAEYVLLLDRDEIFVAVGSDHTDRALERQSVIKAKQICPNVMSGQVWRYSDVRDRWDTLLLRSTVRDATGAEVVYQEAPLGAILPPEALIDLIQSRMPQTQCLGLVIFSGTIPLKVPHPNYGEYFRAELIDPRASDRLTCEYRAIRIDGPDGN